MMPSRGLETRQTEVLRSVCLPFSPAAPLRGLRESSRERRVAARAKTDLQPQPGSDPQGHAHQQTGGASPPRAAAGHVRAPRRPHWSEVQGAGAAWGDRRRVAGLGPGRPGDLGPGRTRAVSSPMGSFPRHSLQCTARQLRLGEVCL